MTTHRTAERKHDVPRTSAMNPEKKGSSGIPGRRAGRKIKVNDKINCLITDYPERAGLVGSLRGHPSLLAACMLPAVEKHPSFGSSDSWQGWSFL